MTTTAIAISIGCLVLFSIYAIGCLRNNLTNDKEEGGA